MGTRAVDIAEGFRRGKSGMGGEELSACQFVRSFARRLVGVTIGSMRSVPTCSLPSACSLLPPAPRPASPGGVKYSAGTPE